MKMKSIVNLDNKFFYIIDKETGETKRLEVDKDTSMIGQINRAYDIAEEKEPWT